jgi:uncharacterized protein
VQPRAARNRVAGLQGDAVKVQVTAPPVGGVANDALVEVLAEWLDVPRRAIAIVQGQTARTKVVEIETGDPALRGRIEAAVQALVDKGKGRA